MAALVLAPILAGSEASYPDRSPSRHSAQSGQALVSDAVAPAASFDLPPPVQASHASKRRRGDGGAVLPADRARDLPPPVHVQQRARPRGESRALPHLPEAVRAAPPTVLGQEKAQSRAESRALPHLPEAVRAAPPPSGADPISRDRPESRAALLLEPARSAPPPVPADPERSGRGAEDAIGVAFILAQLRDLPPEAGHDGERRKVEHQDFDPLPSAAPFVPPPAPEPGIRSGTLKKKRQWINLPETARTGQVVLTIQELLEPEPLPARPADHPLLSDILDAAPPLGIHDTPELAALRLRLAEGEARAAALEEARRGSDRSARRWRFATVGLAVVLVLTGARRR
jgi:hypothetical protein